MPFANTCCKCKIAADDFNRANADDPGDFTEVGGSDYDVQDNYLLCATAGLLIHDTAHPDGATGRQHVSRKFWVDDTAQHARVVLGYTDASNYCYASVEQVSSCWTLRIYKVVAGTPTELVGYTVIADGVTLEAWHTLEACLDASQYPTAGDILRAKVKLSNGRVYGVEVEDDSLDLATGTKAGIDDSVDVRCDDFYFGYMSTASGCRQACPDCRVRECTIESDDFASEVTCRWTEVSGNPTVSGGAYNFSGAALTILRQGSQNAEDEVFISAAVSLSSGTTGTIRLVIAYLDADNYIFGEMVIDGATTTIQIGQVNGGTESYLEDEQTTSGTSGTLCLQYRPGEEAAPTSDDTGSTAPDSVTSSTGWSDANNALVNDGNQALYVVNANDTSDALAVQWDAGTVAAIPAGSTIDGILVTVDGGHDGLSASVDSYLDMTIGALSNTTQGPVAVPTTGGFTFGGPTDLLGFGALTAEDVNGENIGASITFDNNDLVEQAQVVVDVILLTIYYTTPAQEQGVITLSLNGTTCTAATGFGEGKQAGLESVAGNWAVDSVLYSYAESDTRPACPECDCAVQCPNCCPSVAEFLLVDLTDFGWSCHSISGWHILAFNGIDANGNCTWIFTESVSAPSECGGGTLSFAVLLTLVSGASTCRWVLSVTTTVNGGSPEGLCRNTATYSSDSFSIGSCQFPVTLSNPTNTTDDGCPGSIPASIPLEEA